MNRLVILLALLMMFTSVSSADQSVQRGHEIKKLENKGKAIEAMPAHPIVKPLSRNMGTAISLNKVIAKVNSECRVENTNPKIQVNCINENFFYGGKPIHPKIIEEFSTWLSDSGDQIVAINLENSQGSNKYCCMGDFSTTLSAEKILTATIKKPDDEWFSYKFHGATDNGLLLVETIYGTSGSGVFSELVIFRAKEIPVLELSETEISQSDKKRVYLEKLFTFLLGDRKQHSIKIEGNLLNLDGGKIDLSSI